MPLHSPAGSWPFGMLVHVPSLPAMLQALHVPGHVPAQHTPSSQVSPLSHWPVEVHASPCIPRGVHTPPEQKAPASQSVVVMQLVAQRDI
jgi:hypothetical protein